MPIFSFFGNWKKKEKNVEIASLGMLLDLCNYDRNYEETWAKNVKIT